MLTEEEQAENLAALRDCYRWAKAEGRLTLVQDCIVAKESIETRPYLVVLAECHQARMVLYRQQITADYAAWEAAIKASPDGRAAPPQDTARYPGAPDRLVGQHAGSR